MATTFLDAEWRKLLMANYAIDAKILQKYVPHNTEIDYWNANCYVSLVGFMFLNTKMLGIKIPFHINFEEVNLRFYVRYKEGDKWRRGVVFIKEIVPKIMLSLVANTLYREHYETMPMKHFWETNKNENKEETLTVEYSWKKDKWHSLKVIADAKLSKIEDESEEEFITEHYWGYTKFNDKKTSEYGVEHPKWDIYKVKEYFIDIDFEQIYGEDFKFLQDLKPTSVFLAEGSQIKVNSKRIV